jgi:hypothetical protein
VPFYYVNKKVNNLQNCAFHTKNGLILSASFVGRVAEWLMALVSKTSKG